MKTDKQKLDTLKKRQAKQNEYIKEKFDRVSVVMPKGRKEIIAKSGIPINQYINIAIEEKLIKDNLIKPDTE